MPGKKKLLCLFAAIRPVNRIKIKGMVRAKGGIQSQQWYPYSKVQALRKKCRTQSLWNLHLAGAAVSGGPYQRAKERASSIAVDIDHVCACLCGKKNTTRSPPHPLPSSGDWHHAMENKSSSGSRPHLMRVMLIQNVAVDQRFANGAFPKQASWASLPPKVWPFLRTETSSAHNESLISCILLSLFAHISHPLTPPSHIMSQHRILHGSQGRLLHWHPEATASLRKALPAYCPDLSARFCKESSLKKVEMMPDMDFMDLGARQENLNVRGEPILLQLCMVPAYALTVRSSLG